MPSIDTLCVEITLRCPLRCRHCSAFASPVRDEAMSVDAFAATLASLGRLREIYVSGGEPLDHPEAIRFVSMAAAAAPVVVLYTSGTTASGSVSSSDLGALESAGLTRIDLTVLDADPERHDSMTRVPGSLERALRTIDRARRRGLRWGLHHVPISNDVGSLERTIALAEKLGAARVHVLALAPQGRAVTLPSTQPSPELLSALSDLRTRAWPFELVYSRSLRRALGDASPTPRDEWNAAFLDVQGNFHPGEGQRWPTLTPIPIATDANHGANPPSL